MAHSYEKDDVETRVRTIEVFLNITAGIFAVFGAMLWGSVILG
tara:strand:+ start:343 stop:471 length:129 start_codon:yes stop_codon:yes gene_type:complete